jgi:hypothetical protein
MSEYLESVKDNDDSWIITDIATALYARMLPHTQV